MRLGREILKSLKYSNFLMCNMYYVQTYLKEFVLLCYELRKKNIFPIQYWKWLSWCNEINCEYYVKSTF